MAFDYKDKIEYNRGIHHIRNYMDDDIILFRNPRVRRRVKFKRLAEGTVVETKEQDNDNYKDYPAAVVLCCISNDKYNGLRKPKFYFGESGEPFESSTYKNNRFLNEIINILGDIGGKSQVTSCSNLVGRCAEQHAAKLLLDKYSQCSRKDIVFSSAFRPRTDEVIPYCANCKKLFF